jgi:hypothetical protein
LLVEEGHHLAGEVAAAVLKVGRGISLDAGSGCGAADHRAGRAQVDTQPWRAFVEPQVGRRWTEAGPQACEMPLFFHLPVSGGLSAGSVTKPS